MPFFPTDDQNLGHLQNTPCHEKKSKKLFIIESDGNKHYIQWNNNKMAICGQNHDDKGAIHTHFVVGLPTFSRRFCLAGEVVIWYLYEESLTIRITSIEDL